jgi:hypothetical protein
MNGSDLETLSDSITKTIRRLKRDGVTAMGLANLKQITPTKGLTCHPRDFHRMFPELADSIAKRMRFPIIPDRSGLPARVDFRRTRLK